MRQPRRRRGFEQAGTVPAGQLGFPSRRTRELTLLQGWERVAGKTLSRHARARGIERGVLHVEVAERAWFDAVEPLLPQLAARIAVEQPRLGIKKYALHLAGAGAAPEPRLVPEFIRPVADVADEGAGDGRTPQSAKKERRQDLEGSAPSAVTVPELKHRLERAARRYVDRKRPQKP